MRIVYVVASLDVTKITMMTHLLTGTSVGHTLGVPVRTGRHATFAQISELVDVESMFSGCKSRYLSSDLNMLTLDLDELCPSVDTRTVVFLKHAYSVVSQWWRVAELMHRNMLIGTILRKNDLVA